MYILVEPLHVTYIYSNVTYRSLSLLDVYINMLPFMTRLLKLSAKVLSLSLIVKLIFLLIDTCIAVVLYSSVSAKSP